MGEISTKSYDHPSVLVRRETTVFGAAGTGTKNRFHHYQKIRLKAAHFVVRTAGTADAFTAAIIIGTATIGTATIGTATAGVTSTLQAGTDNSPRGVVGDALDDISATIAGDDTGVVDIAYEYETLHDAAMSD